jgi:hypothetical protein
MLFEPSSGDVAALDFNVPCDYPMDTILQKTEAAMRQIKNGQLEILLKLLEESFIKKAWHGPNLRGSLRGMTIEEAAWRPGPDRHNIWEILVHCAYWKYIVRRRILGEKKGSFPWKGSNWFKRPLVLTEAALSRDIALLEETHRTMVEAIASLRIKELKRIPKNSKISNEAMIRGIASHDVYHAGQIQLLKKLMK